MCTICSSYERVLVDAAAGVPLTDPTGLAGYAAVREAVSTANLSEGSDATAGTGTAYTMSVGDVFSGTISSGSDSDWIAVSLSGGENYVFSAWGTGGWTDGLNDTVLTVHGTGGGVLASVDDIVPADPPFPGNQFSVVQFTAPSSGTYYLEVESFDSETGDYQLMAATEFYTVQQAATYIAEIDWGTPSPIYFDTTTITVNLDALTAAGKQLARWALEAWEDAIGVTFQETSDATPGILFSDDQSGAFAGPAYYNPETGVTAPNPSAGIPGATVNISTQWLTDNGTTIDSYSYQTYLHEIGHALGLGHPGPYDGVATYGDDNIHSNDSTLYSVMSYFNPDDNPNVAGDDPTILTPMLADLVAVHGIYGRPAANTGDTVWGSESNVDGWLGTLFGIIFDGGTQDSSFYTGGPVSFTIFDTGGIDTVNLAPVASDQKIDLRPGAVSDIRGTVGGIVIDVDTTIENAIGGSGDDSIVGNAADNRLIGRGGNDTIDGLGGEDTVVLNVTRNSVTVSQEGATLVIASTLGTDYYRNIELFQFSNGTFTAAQLLGDDTVEPAAPTEGDDILTGTGGDDSIDSLGGNDHVSAGAGDDTVVGADGNDDLQGGTGNDSLSGGLGADTLEGGAGDDTLAGGGGSADNAVFAIARGSATVTDLGNGSVRIVSDTLGTDVVSGVEFFTFSDGTVDLDTLLGTGGATGEGGLQVGTEGGDTLTGDAGEDSLFGQGGNDSLNGGSGDDLLAGSAGNDTILGGLGNDEIGGGLGNDSISGGADNDTIGAGQGDDTADGGAGNDIVNGGAGDDVLTGGTGNDTMGAGFNNDDVQGGDGGDSLGGGTGRDTLDGGDGDDSIGGGEGDDLVLGGTGADFLAGGGRNDTIDGGAGGDRINGGLGDDDLIGGAGADIFIFNDLVGGEWDIILDFQDGLDLIRLSGVEGQGLAGKFAALSITDGSFGAVVQYGGHRIDVDGVDAADLDAGDFLFV
ncbi:M10 family metallopeptidase C-terminal domain-containing protein [Aestuariicoccus sp. MJ-SS9]|uniref:M10 family metallopeptidase C-terminal domain-containing protein n=1 Tax=Aestuariicoccus sp. MJ-SS9 TaxID=3079855 RepID=UPI0029151702|nr:M10 family metallopeptidase C-terminal domain-containing protein [Aestuariicoccus sp. MJ-SS9]MDU8912148.1 M10 family metallopeptidase C-terminal domain-containing protein [Aestuariicoccus sp. MJ-SS9]